MRCCIEKAERAIKAKFGESAGLTGLKLAWDKKSGKIEQCFPPITYRFHKKKADGKEEKKASTGYLCFNFCPICGKKAE